MLAQSRNADAQSTVVDVAKTGPEPVRVAAIRELDASRARSLDRAARGLFDRHRTGQAQVVVSLGERADASSLFHIAQSENDDRLRDTAIVTLGKVGGREQLRVLLARASKETRLAVIRGLFLARDDDGLIHVAEQEKDPELRSEVLSRLKLIGTPKAKEYLQSVK